MVSVDLTGTNSGGSLHEQFCVAANGRLAAFSSISSNFVSGDTNRLSDVFVYDCNARTQLWNTCASLAVPSGNAGSLPISFSPDGRFLLFASRATNLANGIVYGIESYQLYVRDLMSNETQVVTTAFDGTNVANTSAILNFSAATAARITSDGRFVSFLSTATNLVAQADTNNSTDVFIRDLVLSTTELVTSVPDGSAALDRQTSQFFVSTNARYVAFATAATGVVPAIPKTNGLSQVYWRDRAAGTNAVVNITLDGDYPDDSSGLLGMSSDGAFVCFETLATNIVTGVVDTNFSRDIFIRDMFSGETWLVTRTTNNTTPNARSSAREFSRNGEWLLFSSDGEGLVPGVTNLPGVVRNIFAHHLPSRTNAMVSLSFDGRTGPNAFVSANFARISASGRYVLFSSGATNLIPGLTNSVERMFLRDLVGAYTRSVFPYSPFVTPRFDEARHVISENDRSLFFLSQINYDPLVTKPNSTIDLFRAPLFAPRFLTRPANTLRAEGLAGETYVLETSDDLLNWDHALTAPAGADGIVDFSVFTPPATGNRFYRIVWP